MVNNDHIIEKLSLSKTQKRVLLKVALFDCKAGKNSPLLCGLADLGLVEWRSGWRLTTSGSMINQSLHKAEIEPDGR